MVTATRPVSRRGSCDAVALSLTRSGCPAAAARPRSGPAELRRSSAEAPPELSPPELRPADTGGAVAPASRWFQVPLSRRSLTRWRAEPRPEKPKTPSHWSWLSNFQAEFKPCDSICWVFEAQAQVAAPNQSTFPGPIRFDFPRANDPPIENVKLRG